MRKWPILLILLFYVSIANAGQLRVLPPVLSSGGGTSCPSYYASAILSWNGDHDSGVLNACDSSGNAVLFTNSGSDISTYGEGGSNAMKCDAASEDITLTQTAGQYFDSTADQTICMKAYNSAAPTSDTNAFRVSDVVGNDYVTLRLKSAGYMQGQWINETSTDTAAGYSPPIGSWYVMAFSYEGSKVPTNANDSANPGDSTPWANGWADDVDDLDAMTDSPTVFNIGLDTSPGAGKYVYIDEWAIFSGYKVNCSDYF